MGQSLVTVYISEDFRESVWSVLDNALHGQEAANFEFPIFTKDRRRIEILLNATPRCNVKGEVCTRLSFAVDQFESWFRYFCLMMEGYIPWEVVEPEMAADLCCR